MKMEYDEEEDDVICPDSKSYNSSTNSLVQPLLSSDSQSNCSVKIPLTASLFERNTKLAKICVMITVVLERVSYYSLLGNLAVFTNVYLNYEVGESLELVLGFSGFTWISCFVGGVLGDVVLGRFKTIISGLFLYIIGFVSLPLVAHFAKLHQDNFSDDVGRNPGFVAWILFSLVIISLGEGCFKSNMSPFGADQLHKAQDSEMRSFFNYFYWAINIGSFIGYSLLTWLQLNEGFVWGYSIPTCLLALGVIIFCIPQRKNYHLMEPNHSMLKKVLNVCLNSWKKSRSELTTTYESVNPRKHWLDKAKIKYGGKFSDSDVEEVKILFSILPVFGFTIIYCTCYYQISGTFLLQGLHMRLIKFSTYYAVPASWFSLVNIIIVLIFVPIIDRCFYPFLERFEFRTPFLVRMSIGMLLASVSMVSAGTVEYFRLQTNSTTVNHVFGNKTIEARNMTIWYQIPQYGLMGMSEIFVLITGLEFAYCQSPPSMQSFVTCLFFITNGLGALMGVALVAIGNIVGLGILKGGDTKGRNTLQLKGNLHYFFFFLAALNLLNWIAFAIFGIRRAKKKKRKEFERTVAAFVQGSLEASLKTNAP